MTLDAAVVPDPAGEVSAAVAWTQIEKIFASRHFRKADRLRRFLHFVAEEALQGRGGRIKETVIGLQVFDRRAATYDPGLDPIVRVQAGRVRAKLNAYYQQEGAGDQIVIEVPRGQYVPIFRVRPNAQHRTDASAVSVASAYPRNVVAVLPFKNLSAEHDNEYFADGLTEELTHALARIPWLRVTARRSAFQFKATDSDPREIGRLLGADRLIDGSVREAGGKVRVTLRLVDVANGLQLWSGKFERTMHDIFALQDEIVYAIRRTLSGLLGATGDLADADMPARAGTNSLEAFDHYLKGRFHWNRRNGRDLRTAILHFQEAVRVDPGYGRAYSGLADCHHMLGMSGAEAPTSCMPIARRSALRAIEIDYGLAEAHTSLAAVLANFDWDRRAAEREFRRAVEIDGDYATAHHWYSLICLLPEGRFAEALDEIGRAKALDPISLPINLAHSLVLLLSNDCAAAISQCEKVLGLDPDYYRAYWFLGLAHDRLGNSDAAIAALETARNRGSGENAFHGHVLGALGRVCARNGHADRALAIIGEMTAMAITAYIDPFEMAQVYVGLGDEDAALRSLERAADERSGYLVHIAVWPGFETLRQNLRFRALLSRLSLPLIA